MKYLSLTLLIIAAMATNMVSDLNFADGSSDGHGWDIICALIIGISFSVLIYEIVTNPRKDN